MTENTQKRTVEAPASDDPSAAVVSVELEPNEDVDWIWTHRPDGKRVVTGYEIKPRKAP